MRRGQDHTFKFQEDRKKPLFSYARYALERYCKAEFEQTVGTSIDEYGLCNQ